MFEIEAIDAKDLRAVLSAIKKIEPDSQKKLAAKLKTELKPIADQVGASLQESPLSGLRGDKWGWAPKKATVSFTPGKSRNRATNLVSIRANYGDSAGYPFGIWLGEFARNYSTNRGRALIQNLNAKKPMKGKGGRFAYAQMRLLRPDIVRITTDILNDFMREVERKLS